MDDQTPVDWFARSRASGVAKIVGLHGMQVLQQFLWNKEPSACRPAHGIGIQVGHADNRERQLARDHRKSGRVLPATGGRALVVTHDDLLAQQRLREF